MAIGSFRLPRPLHLFSRTFKAFFFFVLVFFFPFFFFTLLRSFHLANWTNASTWRPCTDLLISSRHPVGFNTETLEFQCKINRVFHGVFLKKNAVHQFDYITQFSRVKNKRISKIKKKKKNKKLKHFSIFAATGASNKRYAHRERQQDVMSSFAGRACSLEEFEFSLLAVCSPRTSVLSVVSNVRERHKKTKETCPLSSWRNRF